MTTIEALQDIRTLVVMSAALKNDTQRKFLLRNIIAVAQKDLGEAPKPKARLTS